MQTKHMRQNHNNNINNKSEQKMNNGICNYELNEKGAKK